MILSTSYSYNYFMLMVLHPSEISLNSSDTEM